jgi:hypothetical protein
MIDALLRFDSREQAVQVGAALGFTKIDPQTKEAKTTEATLDTAVCVIGEHFVPQPNDAEGNPVDPVGDGKWWILVRYLKEESDLPPGAMAAVAPFMVTPDDNDPAIPKNRWA